MWPSTTAHHLEFWTKPWHVFFFSHIIFGRFHPKSLCCLKNYFAIIMLLRSTQTAASPSPRQNIDLLKEGLILWLISTRLVIHNIVKNNDHNENPCQDPCQAAMYIESIRLPFFKLFFCTLHCSVKAYSNWHT